MSDEPLDDPDAPMRSSSDCFECGRPIVRWKRALDEATVALAARDERIRQLEAVVEVVREYDAWEYGPDDESDEAENAMRSRFVQRIHAALLGSPQEPPK